LCSLSADDLKLFVTPLLINVKHINSCLHRTMIKRWMYGFQCNGVDAQTGCAMGALDLMQEERRRLSFTKEYRVAYALVCQAAESLDMQVQVQRNKWNQQTPKQRQKGVTAVQQCLFNYHEVVSDLVLRLLPGQTFLKVYSQEQACQCNDLMKVC